MVVMSSRNAIYNTLTDMLPVVMEKLGEDEKIGDDEALDLFLAPPLNKTDIGKELNTANKLHDEILVRHV